jgi:hypothetical protein
VLHYLLLLCFLLQLRLCHLPHLLLLQMLLLAAAQQRLLLLLACLAVQMRVTAYSHAPRPLRCC